MTTIKYLLITVACLFVLLVIATRIFFNLPLPD